MDTLERGAFSREHTYDMEASIDSTSMEQSQMKHKIQAFVSKDSSSPEQFQGAHLPDQVQTMELQAARSYFPIEAKIVFFPDEEGEFYCLSKDANNIIGYDKTIDCYGDDEVQSTVSTKEFMWKYGYKSKDIDDLDFYFACDSLQDAEDLLCNSSCFSDCCKSFTWDSLMCSHMSILYNFEEKIVFSSDSDGFGSDGDSDIEFVLIEFDLCILLDQNCFLIMETVFSRSK